MSDYPMAHMISPEGGSVHAQAVDGGAVLISYKIPDYWTLLTIYLEPEQALTLASQLREAASEVESDA